MICIKKISFFDYLVSIALDLPTIGRYMIRKSQINDGFLLGAFIDEKPVGIAVAELADNPILTYLFVDDNFREKGIGTELIHEILNYARDKMHKGIRASVILENEYGKTAAHILTKKGFKISDTATIIRYANDENCKNKWNLFMEKRGKRICNTLQKRGFKTLSFLEVTDKVFSSLRTAIGKEFHPILDPFRFVDNSNDWLVEKHSFVTFKDEEPVAFVTVTTVDDQTLVFQQLSTAKKYQDSGVFFLALSSFLESFFASEVFDKVSAVVYDNNDKMKKLVRSFIGPLSESTKTQNNYILKLV